MYIFKMSSGVRGVLLMVMASRYGDMGLGVSILVMFLLVYIAVGIMVSMPHVA